MKHRNSTTNYRALCLGLAIATSAGAAHAGDLVVVGTGDGIEIFQALAREIRVIKPDINVTIPKSVGSDGAVKAVLARENELGRVARPLSADEAAKGLAVKPLMRIPGVIIAHADAKVAGITNKQLVDVFTGKITNWKELGGADLPIKVFVREDGDSVFKVLRSTMPGWASIAVAPAATVISTSTQDMVAAVGKTSGGIGFAPFSVVQRSSLTMLKIDGRAPSDPGYPSAVGIGILHAAAPLSPDAQAFIDFARSADGAKVISWLGAVPEK